MWSRISWCPPYPPHWRVPVDGTSGSRLFGYLSLIAAPGESADPLGGSRPLCGGVVAWRFWSYPSGAAAVMAIPFTALARYLDWVVDGLSSLSLAALPMDSFYYRAWVVFLYLMLGAALLIRGKKRILVPLCAGAATLAFCLLCSALAFRAGELTAAVLDVGQGQSVLLRTGDYLTLVDCGRRGTARPRGCGRRLLQARNGPAGSAGECPITTPTTLTASPSAAPDPRRDNCTARRGGGRSAAGGDHRSGPGAGNRAVFYPPGYQF